MNRQEKYLILVGTATACSYTFKSLLSKDGHVQFILQDTVQREQLQYLILYIEEQGTVQSTWVRGT